MEKRTIKQEMQAVVNRDLIQSEQRINFVDTLRRIREDKYVSKKQIENAMSQYLLKAEDIISTYLELAMRTTINYEALNEVEQSYREVVAMQEKFNRIVANEK